jgi:hypothetical protein
MKPPITVIGLGLVALATLATPSGIRAAPIPEYRASYRAVDEAAASSADVALSHDSVAATYTLIVKRADETAREIETTLRFDLVDDKVRPITYRAENSRCSSCTITVIFNWGAGLFHHNTRGYDSVGSLITRGGSPSTLVNQVALLVTMLPGRRGLAGFDNALTAKSLGTVELGTVLGPVHAEGHALQGPPEATFWLAQELEHLPVRIQAFSRSFATVQLVELHGLELPAAVAAERAVSGAPLATEQLAAADTVPEYRAVYRIDDHRAVGVGRMEIAVSRGAASDSYRFVAQVIETKRPDRPLVIEMSFRVVGDRVQPLELHMEQQAGRRPHTVGIEFDWTLHDAVLRYDERQQRYPLVAFDDRDERELRIEVLEPLAGMLAFLPGRREIAGFDGVLSVQSFGAAEISLPMGLVPVERLVMHGKGDEMSLEVWRARELADLPVRLFGPVMGRRATTMELMELEGLDDAAAGARPEIAASSDGTE